jgi:predicted nucleic acid-binding protein
MAKYYFDSCIWKDHYENRFGPGGRPLGDYATRLFMKVMKNRDTLLFSELVVEELKLRHDKVEIDRFFNIISLLGILKLVDITKEERMEAKLIAAERGVPFHDALHAIIARDNDAIIVTQDRHFNELVEVVVAKRPEELL